MRHHIPAVVLLAGIVLLTGCPDAPDVGITDPDTTEPDVEPCGEAPEYGLTITVTDSVTGEPVTGFTAWVVPVYHDEGDGSNRSEDLEVEGSTARGVREGGEFYAYVQGDGYRLWRAYALVVSGDCGLEAVHLDARMVVAPVPTSMELAPASIEVSEGTSEVLDLVVRDQAGAAFSAPTEWLVRDSAVAEVFGYAHAGVVEFSGAEAHPVVYGSVAGSTWVVVRSGDLADSVQVTVSAGAPLGLNEALIETSARWLRRYRVPITATFPDSLPDPAEVGTLSLEGAAGGIPPFGSNDILEGLIVRVPGTSLEAGTNVVETDTDEHDEPWGSVFIQTAWWRGYGPAGPNSQVYRTEAGSTLTLDSVRIRDGAGPIAYGTLATDSATEYTVVNWDINSYFVDTGRRRDVRITFGAEVQPQPQ